MSSPLLLWMQGWTWIDTWPMVSSFTAFFKTTRIMKLKSQLTTPVFAAVNHLRGPLRKQNFTSTGSKGHGLWLVIGGFRSVLGVSVFQCSLLVIVIMIDGSEKRNSEGGFWTLEFASLWKAQQSYAFKNHPKLLWLVPLDEFVLTSSW